MLIPKTQANRGDSAAGGPRRGFVPQAPTVKICVSAGAPAATLRPFLYSRGHSRVLVCASVLRSLLPAAPPASPVAPLRGIIGRVLYCSCHPSSRAPHRYSVPQPQAAELPFKPSAPPRKHCQRPQLVKGKSPQGARVTVQVG